MRLFSRYGFFRHTLPVWARATMFRMRHGFDYRDCWSLSIAMARWLAPRLRHMSEIAHGAPCGYPNKAASWDAETDFDAWRDDLMRASEALRVYAEVGYMENWSMEREDEIRDGARTAMRWIAEHFTSLWD